MCELINIVCFSFKDFIRFLISVTCFGSRPTVGSSNINIGGFPIRAPARLTLLI